MEYLLVMSLSGSTMTGLYLLLRRRLWDRVSARTFYLLARVAVLYYLIPMPFLKQWYKDAIRMVLPKDRLEAARIRLTWSNYAVHAQGGLHINDYAMIQVTVVAVWLLGAIVLIVRQLLEYVRKTRRFAGYVEQTMTDRHREIIEDFREEYGVKRQIALYQGPDGERAVTFGISRPVITCGREPGSREAELLIRHEMVHIKRLDVVWKILLRLVTFLHWWNLIMWTLYRDFERVCECSCDETVMQGRSREEVKEYLRLLIKEASKQKETKEVSLRWKSGFGDSAEKIKERMDNLMKNKKWNRFAAGVLVAALTFANSMTVFAYRDVVHDEVAEGASQEEINESLDSDTLAFAFDETGAEGIPEFEVLEELEIRYDHQFSDEEGNIYLIEEDGLVEPHCNHDFQPGTEALHRKLSGGGCEVKMYDAERCTKCGYIKRGSLISTTTYVTCPH